MAVFTPACEFKFQKIHSSKEWKVLQVPYRGTLRPCWAALAATLGSREQTCKTPGKG